MCLVTLRYLVPIFINSWCACAANVTVVGSAWLAGWLAVKSHLTSGAYVRPENIVMYSNNLWGFL